eukprot:532064_1
MGNTQSKKQSSSNSQHFDLQFDLVPALYCLLNCPALTQTFNQIKSQNKTKQKNTSIIDEIASLFQTYNTNTNTRKLPSNALKSIQTILKSSSELNLTGTTRHENTAAELIEYLFSTILQTQDSWCILSVPIPRSTVQFIVTVIHIQTHANPTDYNKTNVATDYILLLHGFVGQIGNHENIPLDIYQIILNYIGNTSIPKRYLLTLPSDSRIIDIKLALQKHIQIPIEQYVFCEYDRYAPINQWAHVHGIGDTITNTNTDESQGFSKYYDHHCDDPTVFGLPNGNMDAVCYIKPSNKNIKKMFNNATEFRQVKVFHAIENDYGTYNQLGIGFYITIPLPYELSVLYIIQLLNAMIKPYLNSDYNDNELPYTLKLHHVLHGRFPYTDCSYEKRHGCGGCDLYEYMNKYKIINPDRWRLQCFGIHWKKCGEKLFQHELFKNPMNMFDDKVIIENLKKYHTTNKLSMIKKENNITLLNCIDAFFDQQPELKQKSLRLQLPEILVVKMQRFAGNTCFRFKYRNKETVDVPFNGLDLEKYCNGIDDEKESNCKYDLFAILKCEKPGWNETKVDKYETYFKGLKDNNWYKLSKDFESIQKINMCHSKQAWAMTKYADIVCYVRVH